MKQQKTWYQRLRKEEAKLEERVDALSLFIENNDSKFEDLEDMDQDLLITQHAAMTAYLNVLSIRVKREKCRREKGWITVEEDVVEVPDHITTEDIFDAMNDGIRKRMGLKGEEDGRNS